MEISDKDWKRSSLYYVKLRLGEIEALVHELSGIIEDVEKDLETEKDDDENGREYRIPERFY